MAPEGKESTEFAAFVTHHPLFAKMSLDDLRVFLPLFVEQTFNKDEVIVREGNLVDSIYFIVSGRAEIRKNISTPKGIESHPVALLGPGENIGLSHTNFFSTTGSRTATVIALEKVTTMRLDVVQFRDFLQRYPHANQAILANARLFARMGLLKSAVPFTELGIERLQYFAEKLLEFVLPAGEVIFHQGDMSDNCYLIESGSVEISVKKDQGEKILAELESPAVFGETSLLFDLPHNASARTLEETKLLVLNRNLFSDLIKTESSAAESLMSLQLMRTRPQRLNNIEVYKQHTPDGEVVTLKNPHLAKYFRLSKYGFFIWEKLDGTTSLSEIAVAFYNEFNILNPDIVSNLAIDLHRSGFIQLQKRPKQQNKVKLSFLVKSLIVVRNVMEFRWPFGNSDEWITRTYNRTMWIFFTKVGQLSLALLALGFIGFIGQFSHAEYLLSISPNKWQLVILAYVIGMFSFVFHELAHAYAAKSFGRYVRCFGVGWFWFGPMAFCDTSDMWVANKKARIAVDLAGLYLNLVLAGAAGWCMLFVNTPELIIMLWLFALVNYLAVMANLSPAMELDGYYTLMDILDKPNLRESAIDWLASGFGKKTKGESLIQRIKQHKPEAIYWLVTLIYIVVMEIIFPYILMTYLLHGLFNVKSHLLNILVVCLIIFISLASMWGELQKRRAETAAS